MLRMSTGNAILIHNRFGYTIYIKYCTYACRYHLAFQKSMWDYSLSLTQSTCSRNKSCITTSLENDYSKCVASQMMNQVNCQKTKIQLIKFYIFCLRVLKSQQQLILYGDSPAVVGSISGTDGHRRTTDPSKRSFLTWKNSTPSMT